MLRTSCRLTATFCLLLTGVLAIMAGTAHGGSAPARLVFVGKEVFLQCPRSGVRVVGFADYARATGLDMISYSSEQTRSDTADIAYLRFSADNGRTWSEPQAMQTSRKLEKGTLRRYVSVMFADPDRDVLLTLINQAVLPTDNPLEGMKNWTLRYALSRDGGRTTFHETEIVQSGGEHTAEHPLPGVWVGKNGVMIGDATCVPIRIRTGEILQPVQICPLGPDGQYYNPGGGYTYHDSAVLIGRWNAAGTLDWRLSSLVRGDAARSTRGMLEPTIAEMPDGRILMVLRGSNDRKPDLPGYRWYAVSSDHGVTWSEPRPWTYSDRTPFFSPSSCSQLLRHSNGRIYWIGNISPKNPRGNLPRYPLVIGDVDPDSLLLIRESLCTIDDRGPDDPEDLMISNFHAREDRRTKEIVVHCSPLGRGHLTGTAPAASRPARQKLDWTADACIYRIAVMAGPATRPAGQAGQAIPREGGKSLHARSAPGDKDCRGGLALAGAGSRPQGVFPRVRLAG